ncbi:hypothetical protein DFJ43DRAFT_1073754 [Lentinula guzmanii]|uniref:DUF7918 domain-containing protein n=1 Tax=Lentinula guzmanii TaxID=2804957 RepID=A0AA38JHY8_9AGAR|nr:hypothetical protein DFJ43DRAFT_1073754 [Lentinula guzmanii]
MPSFLSFSASIVVEDKPLDEYNVEVTEVEGLATITCWVPSVVGKKYQVQWKDSVVKLISRGTVLIDGINYGGKVVRRINQIQKKSNYRVSPTAVRPFEFSNLRTTDDEESSLLVMPASIGEIELRIQYWCTTGKATSVSEVWLQPEELTYNEKLKKGIDHQTRLGEIMYSKGRRCFGKSVGKSFLRFLFRYRPLDVLRAHKIAPPALDNTRAPDLRLRSSKRPRPSIMVTSMEGNVNSGASEPIEISDEEEDPQREMEKLQRRLYELKAKHPDLRDRKKTKRGSDVASVKIENGGLSSST